MTVVVDCECAKYITLILTLDLYLFWASTTVIVFILPIFVNT